MPPTMPRPRRRRGQEALTVRLDVNGVLTTAVGPDGIEPADLDALRPELERVRALIAARRREGGLPFAELPYRTNDVADVRRAAEAARRDFDTVVVVGIGGSALGAEALTTALGPSGGDVNVVVADSIDPETIHALLASVDLKRTLFNVV